MIKRFFSMKFTGVIIISILCLSALLILIPYFVTRFMPEDTEPPSEKSAVLEKAEIPEKIDVFRTETGKIETLPFEEYLKGVVSSEMPSTFHAEALKAQAVAARTYSAARVIAYAEKGNPSTHPKAPLCDTTHCQVFRNEKELRRIKGSSWMTEGYKKICDAVLETEGELLYYDGKLVQQALFHSSSGGKTENCENVFAASVPYLVSVESPYEDEATHQDEETTFTIEEFAQLIRKAYPSISFGEISSSNIEIVSRSNGNRVNKMDIGSASLTGRQIREALGLSSANFKIDIDNDIITFTSNGSGHGVGMSQYGADGMAKEGYGYKKILSHYYSGTEVY